jgi:DNA-binding transcriptional LysR family regulator
MELHQIRYFLIACDTLNFTRAAEQCGVSVPSLSRAIRTLEEELGGQLFRRERHLTHLTDLGRLMQQHFSTIDAAANAAKRDAEGYQRSNRGPLRIGVFASFGAKLLTGFLSALRAEAGALEIQIWEANCEELEPALLDSQIDVALTSAPEHSDRVRALPLYHEPYHIAFAPGHRFEKMDTVPLREIDGEDYIKRLHCEFPSNFARLGVAKPYHSVRPRYIGEREDWLQCMVQAGLGCAVMPQSLPLLEGILTRLLVEPEVSRQISLITVAGRPHSAPVATLIRVAKHYTWTQELGVPNIGIKYFNRKR